MFKGGLTGLAKELLSPVVRRAGTVIALYLVGEGVAVEQADLLVNCMGAFLGVAFDTAMIVANRKREQWKSRQN